MDFLFGALRGEKGQPQTGPETIDKLVDRALHATLLEDRRAAIVTLKGLARDWTLAIINVLQNDRMDVEIIKAAIETLTTLFTRQPTADFYKPKDPSSPSSAAADPRDLGVMLTEIFLKDSSNVTILIEILEEVEFYVRYSTVQLLATLLENMGDRVKECIFQSPGGIARLMDLLDDRREIVRNEALLLLISLTANNAEIQKIVAFENAFERLLGLVLEEGASEGGIVVQDCLTLTLNLLRYNVSNQNLFRESSCIQKIPSLLLSHAALEDERGPIPVPLTHEANRWPEQKAINAIAILELVRILVGPNNPNTVVNQAIMNQSQILPALIELAVCERIPSRVKAQALYAVGDVMRGHQKNQDAFSKYVVAPSTSPSSTSPKFPRPALLIVTELALRSEEEFHARAAAAYCFQCLVYANPDTQIALAAMLTPPPNDNPNDPQSDQPQSPGSLMVTTLLNWEASKRDPYKDNQKAKELAVTVRLSEEDGDVSLLHKVMFVLLMATRENADLRILVGVMCLATVWLHSSVTSVKEFLSEGSNVQFLIEQIIQSSGVDPLVQGLAAFLLAICHEFNDDLEPAFTAVSSLQSLITSRIGADVFISRIERLKESKQFQKVSPYFIPSEREGKALPDVYFDAAFVDLLKSTADSLVRAAVSTRSKTTKRSAEASESMVESYKSLISTQDKEIQRLKKALAESEARWKDENDALRSKLAEATD
ncbi:p115 like vesicle tethering protein [Zopfochytrium polystomum]|nr:p115 like vesicle tethering protein [Zopfochytrium polystomum]